MTPGTTTADDDEDSDAEWEAVFGNPEPSLVTGTAIDEFTPIYRSLAKVTTRHSGFSPDQIDQWDITTVAVIYGVGAADDLHASAFLAWQDEYDEWKRSEDAAV